MSRTIITILIFMLCVTTASFADNTEKKANAESAQPAFSDVPQNHWAYSAVQQLQQMGIIKGYPNGKFKGEEKVTRYELAVVLDRFAQALETAIKGTKESVKEPKSEKAEINDTSAAKRLLAGSYIAPDSSLLKDPEKPVTQEEVSQAVASVGARIVELTVPQDPVSEGQTPAQKGNDQVNKP